MDLSSSFYLIFSASMLGALYAVLGAGLNISYSTTRMVNIAFGDLLMIGAFVTYWLVTLLNIHPFVCLAIVGLINALLAIPIYKLAGRRIIRQSKVVSLIEDRSILLFFGLLIIIQNVAAIMWTTNRRAYSFLGFNIPFAGINIFASKLAILVIALLTVLILIVILNKTRFGKSVKFVIQDKIAAGLVGINVDRVYLTNTMLGFAIAAIAGTLVSMYYEIGVFMGIPYTMAGFVVIIIAGLGNIPGVIVGGMLLGFLETFGVYYTTPGFRIVISYLAFMIIVILRPKGLFGKGV